MELITACKEKVLKGAMLTRDEALLLAEEDINPLAAAADEIHRRFCGNSFDLCTSLTAKAADAPRTVSTVPSRYITLPRSLRLQSQTSAGTFYLSPEIFLPEQPAAGLSPLGER